jgi:cyclophilin family peptidyl-prolyl cis-trans isomerase
LLALLALPLSAIAADQPAKSANPNVRMTTSMGVIEIELDAKRAPATVKNFLGYVDSGFYNGTIFHRVIPGFMVQGGGMTPGMKEKPTASKIQNEAGNGLKNLTGTLAMARTSDPHSASAQFFINTVDNAFLDHTAKNPQGWGYAVFGKVTKGMDVVKKIEAVQTANAGMHQNVPENDIVIAKMEVFKGASSDQAGVQKKYSTARSRPSAGDDPKAVGGKYKP